MQKRTVIVQMAYLIKNNHMDTPVHDGNEWLLSHCFMLRKDCIERPVRIIYTPGEKAAAKRRFTTEPEDITRQERDAVKKLAGEWKVFIRHNVTSAVWTELGKEMESIKRTVWLLNGTYEYNANYVGWILWRLRWSVEDMLEHCLIVTDPQCDWWHALLFMQGKRIVAVLMGLQPA